GRGYDFFPVSYSRRTSPAWRVRRWSRVSAHVEIPMGVPLAVAKPHDAMKSAHMIEKAWYVGVDGTTGRGADPPSVSSRPSLGSTDPRYSISPGAPWKAAGGRASPPEDQRPSPGP